MYVKPAPGFVIYDPDLRDRLPPEGREVPDNTYWRKLADNQDVEIVAAEPPKAEE